MCTQESFLCKRTACMINVKQVFKDWAHTTRVFGGEAACSLSITDHILLTPFWVEMSEVKKNLQSIPASLPSSVSVRTALPWFHSFLIFLNTAHIFCFLLSSSMSYSHPPLSAAASTSSAISAWAWFLQHQPSVWAREAPTARLNTQNTCSAGFFFLELFLFSLPSSLESLVCVYFLAVILENKIIWYLSEGI